LLSIAIQAGGSSSRIGRDKALLLLRGVPLISHVIERVASLADEIIIITNQPERYLFLKKPLVADLFPGTGVLGGLCTALIAANNSFVGVLACDMPFINGMLFSQEYHLAIRDKVDLVIPETPAGLQPLHAVYRRRSCLPYIHTALKYGERRLVSWYDDLNVYMMTCNEIAVMDPQFQSFGNINTLEDLNIAQRPTNTKI